MQVIWKHELTKPSETILLPRDAEVFHVREQENKICIWFRCDHEAPKTEREFMIRGTGDAYPGNRYQYRGTVQLNRGLLVFHVFEKVL